MGNRPEIGVDGAVAGELTRLLGRSWGRTSVHRGDGRTRSGGGPDCLTPAATIS